MCNYCISSELYFVLNFYKWLGIPIGIFFVLNQNIINNFFLLIGLQSSVAFIIPRLFILVSLIIWLAIFIDKLKQKEGDIE